jgi:hypothetical protein
VQRRYNRITFENDILQPAVRNLLKVAPTAVNAARTRENTIYTAGDGLFSRGSRGGFRSFALYRQICEKGGIKVYKDVHVTGYIFGIFADLFLHIHECQ